MPWRYPSPAQRSLPDIGEQRHETGALDRVLDGALEGGAVPRALAAEHLAQGTAELLQSLHVLVIDERGARAALLGAEPAAILAVSTELLSDHRCCHPSVRVR